MAQPSRRQKSIPLQTHRRIRTHTRQKHEIIPHHDGSQTHRTKPHTQTRRIHIPPLRPHRKPLHQNAYGHHIRSRKIQSPNNMATNISTQRLQKLRKRLRPGPVLRIVRHQHRRSADQPRQRLHTQVLPIHRRTRKLQTRRPHRSGRQQRRKRSNLEITQSHRFRTMLVSSQNRRIRKLGRRKHHTRIQKYTKHHSTPRRT